MRFTITHDLEYGYTWDAVHGNGRPFASGAWYQKSEAAVLRSLRRQFGYQGHTVVKVDGWEVCL